MTEPPPKPALSPQEQEKFNRTLLDAVEANDLAKVNKALDDGANINTKDFWGHMPLHYAASYGEKDIVEALLKYKNKDATKNVNVNAIDNEGLTPLDYANKKESLAKIADYSGSIDLLRAKNAKTAKELEPGKADNPDKSKEQDERNKALFEAVIGHDAAEVKKALENGAEVNAKGVYNRTPLFIAAVSGNKDILAALLEKGANVNAADQNNYTPLHAAAYNENLVSITALLEQKDINVNAKDKDGQTPLDYALEEKEGKEISGDAIEMLKAHGAKTSEELGKTPEVPKAPSDISTPTPNGFFDNIANWLAPLATFGLVLGGMSMFGGGMGIVSFITAAVLAGGAAIGAMAFTKTGLFAETPAPPVVQKTTAPEKEKPVDGQSQSNARDLQKAKAIFDSGYMPTAVTYGNGHAAPPASLPVSDLAAAEKRTALT